MDIIVGDSINTSHPFRSPLFLRVWIGTAISLLGDQFYLIVLPWAILKTTGSVLTMSTVLLVSAVPRAGLMLVGGVASDRYPSRKILLATTLMRGVVVALAGILIWLHILLKPELYVLGFAFGVADAFALPAMQTYLMCLVSHDHLIEANSIIQTTTQLITMIGPAAAALITNRLGPTSGFLLDAFSFLVLASLLWTLPDRQIADRHSGSTVWTSILEGIQYVRRDRPLLMLIMLILVVNVCLTGPIVVGLPYLASVIFGMPAAYGYLLSAWAVGGVLGKLISPYFKLRFSAPLIFGVSVFMGICLILIGMLPRLWFIGVVLLLMGVVSGLVTLQVFSWCLLRTVESVRGRVTSVFMWAGGVATPLSVVLAGAMIRWNVKLTFVLAGIFLPAVSVVIAMWRATYTNEEAM